MTAGGPGQGAANVVGEVSAGPWEIADGGVLLDTGQCCAPARALLAPSQKAECMSTVLSVSREQHRGWDPGRFFVT